MKAYGDLDFQSVNYVSNVMLKLAIETGLPASPEPGRVIFHQKRVMVCVELADGVPMWVPLTNEISAKIHTQTSPSDTWVITHDFNSSSVFVQVYDNMGISVLPDSVNTSVKNRVTVSFNANLTGRAIVMLGELSGVPKDDVAFEQSFTNSTTWVVEHGLGYNPIIRIYIGGREVQPLSVVNNSTTQATITFSTAQTGNVRCI